MALEIDLEDVSQSNWTKMDNTETRASIEPITP